MVCKTFAGVLAIETKESIVSLWRGIEEEDEEGL
jgi:hypothetical protein